MNDDEIPDPPPGLLDRGSGFWRTTTSDYVLTPSELEVLAEVCRCMDDCWALDRAVADGGVIVEGSKGQPRVHPAMAELRQQRALLGRLMAQLALPDESGGVALRSPASAKGAAGARRRWEGHTRQRDSLGETSDG